jgi:hypothetical protein
MPDLKTSQPLLDALREAASRKVSSEELHAQRVSFIMGSVNTGITREQIQQELAKQEGSKKAS